MARDKLSEALSRRERQVMNILFRRGEATVAEVMDDLPDPPTYSAVRSVLRILAGKGLVSHHEEGPRYVYAPSVDTDRARDESLRQVVRTFFDGSAEQAVTALLRISDGGADATGGPRRAVRARGASRDDGAARGSTRPAPERRRDRPRRAAGLGRRGRRPARLAGDGNAGGAAPRPRCAPAGERGLDFAPV